MLSSIQNTANYQNYKPNFGNLSEGIAETLIIAAKREGGGYCTLQEVRELAELAKGNGFHVGKDITSEREKAVSAYNLKGYFTVPMQAMARRDRTNLFEATKKVVQEMTSDWEKKLAEIRAKMSKNPKSDADLEQEIRKLAVKVIDKW